jgi:hypothetical protein
MADGHNSTDAELGLPLPILKKVHPCSAAASPRPESPVPSDTLSAYPSDVSHSPVVPSPLRSAASMAPDTPASVTFSNVPKPVVPSSTNAIPTAHPHHTPQHSILKLNSGNSSRRSSISEGDNEAEAHPSKPSISLLQPPPIESNSRRGASPSGHSRSNSHDRSRVVGKSNYGGRQGGPSMLKSRTSSSGGLSDSDMRPGYERKVGFDTMVDAEDTPGGYFTFCLQVKSHGYVRTKNTRTFMCAVDDNAYSERALEWLMESLVGDGDEIVAVRVLEGTPDEIDQEAARDEARELMASIVQLNEEVGSHSISIVVEFVANQTVGRVTSSILGYIYMYRPDSLTVGTRGKSVSAFQKMLGGVAIGSCSR